MFIEFIEQKLFIKITLKTRGMGDIQPFYDLPYMIIISSSFEGQTKKRNRLFMASAALNEEQPVKSSELIVSLFRN